MIDGALPPTTFGASGASIRSDRPLPGVAKGLIAAVKALETSSPGVFRLLLRGAVFQAKLPINVASGDAFIAKVLSAKPLILSVSDIVQPGKSAELLPSLLAALNIKPTDEATTFVSYLLGEKKPLVKSKIERAIAFMERLGSDLDRWQIAFLAQVYLQRDEFLAYMVEKEERFMRESLDEIMREIFAGVLALVELRPSPATLDPILDGLALRVGEYSPRARHYPPPDRDDRLLDLALRMEATIESGEERAEVADQIALLTRNVVRFLATKATYNRFDVYPDFVVLLADPPQLVRIEGARSTTGKGGRAVSLGTEFEIQAKKVTARAMTTDDRIFAEYETKLPLGSTAPLERRLAEATRRRATVSTKRPRR